MALKFAGRSEPTGESPLYLRNAVSPNFSLDRGAVFLAGKGKESTLTVSIGIKDDQKVVEYLSKRSVVACPCRIVILCQELAIRQGKQA